MENNNKKNISEVSDDIIEDKEEKTRLPSSEKLCSFEFNVKNEEESKAFLMFQKKYVYKKNIIQSAAFGVVAVGFAVSAYRDPSMAVNYILLAVCLAAIAVIWYNTWHIRRSLVEALKMLEDDRYIFSLYDDSIVIETIVSEEEKNDEDFVPIKPNVLEIDEQALDVSELDDMFVIIVKKETIYVLPKRCISDEQAEAIRKKLIPKE